MFTYKKLLCAGLACLTLSITTYPVQALDPILDPIESSGIESIAGDASLVTIKKNDVGVDPNFNNIGKIRWNQFNIPSTQQVDFEFTDSGQTIINVVDAGFTVNPSLISGKLNTFGTNGICGRVFLINPNGVSFNGAKINADLQINNGRGDYYYEEGTPSFLVSSLSLATAFDAIDDDTPNIQLDTFVDANSFANGILVLNSDFGVNENCWYDKCGCKFKEGTLKEISFIGNGVLIKDSDFDITFDGSERCKCSDYDNFFNAITFGKALVSLLDDGDRDLTEISFLEDNLVPACTDNTNGGVRYYEFDPETDPLEITNNLASEYQIAICNDYKNDKNQIEIGPKEGFQFCDCSDGVFRVENRSDYFNTLEVPSIVKLASRVCLNEGKYSCVNPDRPYVVFLTSKNPGQTTEENDPSLLYICPQSCGCPKEADLEVSAVGEFNNCSDSKTSIYVGKCGSPRSEVQLVPQETEEDNPDNQYFLKKCGDPCCPPNKATKRTKIDTALVEYNPESEEGDFRDVVNKPSNDPNEPCDPDNCFGDCDVPPDPSNGDVPPPPPPVVTDGGGAAAAIAIPVGIAGAAGLGALGLAPTIAGNPAPVATPIVYTPYYLNQRVANVCTPEGIRQAITYDWTPAYGTYGQTMGAASPITNTLPNRGYYYYPQTTGGASPLQNQGYYNYPQNTGAVNPLQSSLPNQRGYYTGAAGSLQNTTPYLGYYYPQTNGVTVKSIQQQIRPVNNTKK